MRYFGFLLLLAANLLSAQKNNALIGRENLFVQTNAQVLVTGETLYYQLYCLQANNNQFSPLSKVAYLQLVDRNRNVVSTQKIMLENGIGNGDCFIPTTLKSGSYKLIAFTRWMLGDGNRFFETDIAIINPYATASVQIQSDTARSRKELPAVVTSEVLSLHPEKKIYGLREKVNLKITGHDAIGHYALSVRKVDELPYGQSQNTVTFATAHTNEKPQVSARFVPELRGEIVSGKITSNNGKSVSHKTVALSIPGASFAFKLVSTDARGGFIFVLDKNLPARNSVVQIVGEDRNEYAIVLDPVPSIDLTSLVFPDNFRLNPAWRNSIEKRMVASQIENAYIDQKKDSVPLPVATVPFFDSLQKEYILDNYTRFPTIKETITEVLEEVNYKKTKDHYQVFLKDYYTENALYGPPLVLVDGILIQDLNLLFDFPAAHFSKVALVNAPYIYGPKTFGGIISFTTRNADFPALPQSGFIQNTVLFRPIQSKKYFNPDYAADANKRIPDYRTQLLWEPEIKLNDGESVHSYYTSDVSGTYEIILQGFSATGNPVYVRDYFEVR
ncbi:hypothetical protein [Flavobacterium sp.]|uniref:hypothetical protein n=1 Tax=Flavobacterium sp. TaxID=239 RepID=UPI0039E5BF43